MPVSKNAYTGYAKVLHNKSRQKKIPNAELNCQVANGLFSYMFVLLKIAHNYSLQVRSANKRKINNSIPVTQGQDTISSAKATSFSGN